MTVHDSIELTYLFRLTGQRISFLALQLLYNVQTMATSCQWFRQCTAKIWFELTSSRTFRYLTTSQGSAQFQTSAQASYGVFDHSLLLERNAYEGLLPDPIGVILKPEDKTGDKLEDLEITNFKCIGSYSWIDTAKDMPTILIPGKSSRIYLLVK